MGTTVAIGLGYDTSDSGQLEGLRIASAEWTPELREQVVEALTNLPSLPNVPVAFLLDAELKA